MRILRTLLSLAALTATETIRQPLCLILTLCSVLLTILIPMVLMFKLGEDGKLARESAIAIHFLFGFGIATIVTSSSLTKDMTNGTALTILSKPVGRNVFLTAKFFGVSLAIAAFSLSCLCASLIGERIAEHFQQDPQAYGYITDWNTAWIALSSVAAALTAASILNYKTGASFESAAFWLILCAMFATLLITAFFERDGSPAPFGLRLDIRLIPAGILIMSSLLVLTALATAISTRAGTVPCIILTFLIFTAGLISPDLLENAPAAQEIWGIFHGLLPDWKAFWTAEALRDNGTIPWSYVGQTISYALIYITGVLALGIFSFRTVDLK